MFLDSQTASQGKRLARKLFVLQNRFSIKRATVLSS